jgi:hypothetical protein
VGDIMATNHEIITVEYRFKFKSLQLTKEDCPRIDISGISLLRDVRCVINDANKLVQLTKYLKDEIEFTKIYRKILHLLKVSVLPLAIKALIHFWDPDYRCFTFGDINMVLTIKKYDVLTYFPEDVHKLYFNQRIENTMEKFAKLLGIHQMNQYREKNNSTGLR